MTQDQLTKLLGERGWKVSDIRDRASSCGLSIHATSPAGYLLSIQGGEGLRSKPRRKTEEYTEVEFAIWKVEGEGTRSSRFIKDSRINQTNDDVYNYETYEVLMRAIELIESWIPGNDPPDMLAICRDNAPYRDLN